MGGVCGDGDQTDAEGEWDMVMVFGREQGQCQRESRRIRNEALDLDQFVIRHVCIGREGVWQGERNEKKNNSLFGNSTVVFSVDALLSLTGVVLFDVGETE